MVSSSTSTQRLIHAQLIGVYMLIYVAAIVVVLLAVQEDRLAVITGQFKSQTGIFGLFLDNFIKNEVYVDVHREEMVLSLREDGDAVEQLTLFSINYKVQCEKESVLWLVDEEDRKMFCELEFGGEAFVGACIGVCVMIVLTIPCLVKSKYGRMRYWTSVFTFLIGAVMILIYFVVLWQLEQKECIIPQILQDKFGFIFWVIDIFADMERWCLRDDRAWLTIAPDKSTIWILVTGIVMAVAGAVFWIPMNMFVSNKKSTMRKIKDKFTPKKKGTGTWIRID